MSFDVRLFDFIFLMGRYEVCEIVLSQMGKSSGVQEN